MASMRLKCRPKPTLPSRCKLNPSLRKNSTNIQVPSSNNILPTTQANMGHLEHEGLTDSVSKLFKPVSENDDSASCSLTGKLDHSNNEFEPNNNINDIIDSVTIEQCNEIRYLRTDNVTCGVKNLVDNKERASENEGTLKECSPSEASSDSMQELNISSVSEPNELDSLLFFSNRTVDNNKSHITQQFATDKSVKKHEQSMRNDVRFKPTIGKNCDSGTLSFSVERMLKGKISKVREPNICNGEALQNLNKLYPPGGILKKIKQESNEYDFLKQNETGETVVTSYRNPALGVQEIKLNESLGLNNAENAIPITVSDQTCPKVNGENCSEFASIQEHNLGINLVDVKHVELEELASMKQEFDKLSDLYSGRYETMVKTKSNSTNTIEPSKNRSVIKLYLNCWPKELSDNSHNIDGDKNYQGNNGNLNIPSNTSIVMLKSVPPGENVRQMEDLPLILPVPNVQSQCDQGIRLNGTLKKEKPLTEEEGRKTNGIVSDKLLKMKLKKVNNPFISKTPNGRMNFEPGNNLNKSSCPKNLSPKSLAVKPAPNILGDKKASNKVDELKDIDFTKPWPKNIRTYYARTNYEMRQRYKQRYPNGPQDTDKLRMVDLIFYNPPTNPMKVKPEEKIITTPSSDVLDNQIKGSEGNVELVPQLKVGPEGLPIIDLKSMPQKTKEITKSGDVENELLKPFRKRKVPEQKRSWSHSETVKFYKVLHTVGADFTLMATLFPNRTRKTLKLKFKREERLNGVLIDKVLMNPANFDLEALKKQLEEDEKQVEEVKGQNVGSEPSSKCGENRGGKKPRGSRSTAKFKFDCSKPDIPPSMKTNVQPNIVPHDLFYKEGMDLLRASARVSTGKEYREISEVPNKRLKKKYFIHNNPTKRKTKAHIIFGKNNPIAANPEKEREFNIHDYIAEWHLDDKIISNADEEIKIAEFEGNEDSIMVFDFTCENDCVKTLAEFNELKRKENLAKIIKKSTERSGNRQVSPLIEIEDSTDSDCKIIEGPSLKVRKKREIRKKTLIGKQENVLSTKKRPGRPKLSGPNKKFKPTCKSKLDNYTPQVRNLQSIAAERLEDEYIESLEASPRPETNQIIINTNIVYNALNITQSVSYDTKNFNYPLDINTTIDHQPNISNKSDT